METITVADGNILVKTGGELVLLTPQDGRKAERLFWLSRLYPLKSIDIYSAYDTEPYRRGQWTVRLDRATREQLRHRYGPRPYGPLPPSTT